MAKTRVRCTWLATCVDRFRSYDCTGTAMMHSSWGWFARRLHIQTPVHMGVLGLCVGSPPRSSTRRPFLAMTCHSDRSIFQFHGRPAFPLVSYLFLHLQHTDVPLGCVFPPKNLASFRQSQAFPPTFGGVDLCHVGSIMGHLVLMRRLVLLDESFAKAFLCSDRKQDALRGWILEREQGRSREAVVVEHAAPKVGTVSRRSAETKDEPDVSNRVQLVADEERSRFEAKLDGEEAMIVLFVRPTPKLFSGTSPFFRTCAGTHEPTLCSLEALECINTTCSTSERARASTPLQRKQQHGSACWWMEGWRGRPDTRVGTRGTWMQSCTRVLKNRSYLVSNLNRKWMTVKSYVCDGYSSMQRGGALPSPYMEKRYGWLCTLDVMLQVVLDGYLGLQVAHTLSSYTAVLVTGAQEVGDKAPATFADFMYWMMREPGGLKLHEETSLLYGHLFLQSLSWWSWAIAKILPLHMQSLVSFLIATLCIGGLSSGLAIANDGFALSTWIVDRLHFCLSSVYVIQLRGIAWAWLLVRGKRRNKVEGRPDTVVEYLPLEHVIAGVLMLAPLVLILPTTVLFYLFACLLSTAVHLIRKVLQIVSTCLHSFPTVGLGLYLLFPCFYPDGLLVEIVHLPFSQPQQAIRIASTTKPVSRCFTELKAALRSQGSDTFQSPLAILEGIVCGRRAW